MTNSVTSPNDNKYLLQTSSNGSDFDNNLNIITQNMAARGSLDGNRPPATALRDNAASNATRTGTSTAELTPHTNSHTENVHDLTPRSAGNSGTNNNNSYSIENNQGTQQTNNTSPRGNRTTDTPPPSSQNRNPPGKISTLFEHTIKPPLRTAKTPFQSLYNATFGKIDEKLAPKASLREIYTNIYEKDVEPFLQTEASPKSLAYAYKIILEWNASRGNSSEEEIKQTKQAFGTAVDRNINVSSIAEKVAFNIAKGITGSNSNKYDTITKQYPYKDEDLRQSNDDEKYQKALKMKENQTASKIIYDEIEKITLSYNKDNDYHPSNPFLAQTLSKNLNKAIQTYIHANIGETKVFTVLNRDPGVLRRGDSNNFTNNQRKHSNGFINGIHKHPIKTGIAIAAGLSLSIALPVVMTQQAEDATKDAAEREGDARVRENKAAQENKELREENDKLTGENYIQKQTIKELQRNITEAESAAKAAQQRLNDISSENSNENTLLKDGNNVSDSDFPAYETPDTTPPFTPITTSPTSIPPETSTEPLGQTPLMP